MPQSAVPLSDNHHHHFAESPSTGHTTLVTPISHGGKLKKGIGGGMRGGTPEILGGYGRSEDEGGGGDEELVVVTYEEGLAKLGMTMRGSGQGEDIVGGGGGGRPHHILYPDPPAFKEIEVGVHTPDSGLGSGSGSGSGRTIPGRAGLGAGNGKWGERMRGGGKPVKNAGGVEVGLQRNGTLQSSWLPSYYHSNTRGREAEEEGSDLGYRTEPVVGVRVTGTRYPHRI